MSRRRTARSGFAFAASVGLHLALLGLVLRWAVPPAPGPAGSGTPLAVVLRPQAPARPAPSDRPVASPAPRRATEGTRPASGGASNPGEAAWAPGSPGASDSAGAGGDGGADLRPRLPGGAPAWFGAPVPTTQQALERQVTSVMDGLRAEDLARYPDASWTGLRDALAAGFLAPERALELAEKQTSTGGGGPNGFGRFAQAYGDMVGQYGRTGTTLPRDVEAPGDHDNPRTVERVVAAAGAARHPERAALAGAIDGLDAQGPRCRPCASAASRRSWPSGSTRRARSPARGSWWGAATRSTTAPRSSRPVASPAGSSRAASRRPRPSGPS